MVRGKTELCVQEKIPWATVEDVRTYYQQNPKKTEDKMPFPVTLTP